jgi:hypothetical protein
MARDIEAGRAFVRLLVEDSEFRKQLDASLRSVDGFTKSLKSVGTSLALTGAALTAPFAAAATIFAKAGSELKDMSDRTGISVQALSELKFAAEQSGTSLRDIGLAAREMQTKGLDPRTFDEVVTRIAAIENPVSRAQAAFEAFGKRAGSALLPMLNDLPKLRDRARELGITMDKETAEAADKLGDSIDELKAAGTAFAIQVGGAFAPALTKLSELLAENTAGATAFVRENRELIVVAGLAGVALTGLGGTMVLLAKGINTVTVSVVALRAALTFLATHPIVALGLGVVGAAAAGLAANPKFRGTTSGQNTTTAPPSTPSNPLLGIEEGFEQASRSSLNQLRATRRAAARIAQEALPKVGGNFLLQVLEEAGRGKPGFASPAQVLDRISRDFGPRGTFSGRLAGQIFGGGPNTLSAGIKRLIEKEDKQIQHLQNIDRKLGPRGLGPSHMIGFA